MKRLSMLSLRHCARFSPLATSVRSHAGCSTPDITKGKGSSCTPAAAEERMVESGFNTLPGDFNNEFVGFQSESEEAAKPKLPCDEDANQATPTLVPRDVAEDMAYADKIPKYVDPKAVWKKLARKREKVSAAAMEVSKTSEVEHLRLEKELKEEDKFHWRIGQLAFADDEVKRNDYYALHALSLKLNKARWQMVDVSLQKGVGTTGVSMRATFWKDACGAIIDKGKMPTGQFVDNHPVLRPFADVMQHQKMTKTFLRGFVDARLRVLPQPANVQQLFDHYDKYHGFFLNAQLDLLGVRDDVAEHIMTHIGRALGITQHCVLLWKDYARKQTTMLPADLCADNHVNLALLKNIPMASVDRCVRKILYDLMSHVRDEMNHVRELVPACPTAAWPLLLEAFVPNYYVSFLQKNDFDVSRWFSDEQMYSPGFEWFFLKQMHRFRRSGDPNMLVDGHAPVPYLPDMTPIADAIRKTLGKNTAQRYK
jgi:hypothetical protein